MTDELQQLTDAAVQEDGPQSPLELLAEKHRVLAETKETNVPIAGYDKEAPFLYVRYRLLEGPEIQKLGDKIRREFKNQWQRQMYAAVDTFILACKGFYCDANGDGNVQPLMYQGEHLARYDLTLAEALGFKSKLPPDATARSVVFQMFNQNDAAIAQHNYLLNSWFADTSLDVQSELLGNL